MKLLAMNTSNIEADLCLKNEDKEFCKKVDSSAKHSESVMVEVDKLLHDQNLKVSDLDAICLVVGPGSFTGIRIGISISKGFELVNEKMKLIPVTAFEFLKFEFLKIQPNQTSFACVLNALSGKYYVQTFSLGEPKEAFLTENLNDITDFEHIVGLKEENLPFVTTLVSFAPESLLVLAKQKYENGEFTSEFVPMYLRRSQAEDELDGK